MVVIRNRMRDLRESRAIGRAELAKELGVCRTTIYRLENNQFEDPSYRLIFKIAAYFGEPIDKIFTFVVEGQEPDWTSD